MVIDVTTASVTMNGKLSDDTTVSPAVADARNCVVPVALPVTSPGFSVGDANRATLLATEIQETVFVMSAVLPSLKVPIAFNCRVLPWAMELIDAFEETLILVTTLSSTMIFAIADFPLKLAVISVWPETVVVNVPGLASMAIEASETFHPTSDVKSNEVPSEK